MNTLANYYRTHGLAHYHNGEYDRAISSYGAALASDPEDARSYNGRGLAYHAKGEYDHAIHDYDKAIQIDPENADIYNNRGNACRAKQIFHRAVQDYDKAIALAPENAKLYNNRGIAYNATGDHDRAFQDYDKAIQIDPKNFDAYNNRGNAYSKKGVFDRAIEDFDAAIELMPEEDRTYHYRGNAHHKKGNFHLAAQDFDAAIKLKPTEVAYNGLGLACAAARDYKQAIKNYEKAIALNSQYYNAYNNRGDAHSSQNEHDLAIQDYAKAIELMPVGSFLYSNRGNAYYAKREYDLAIDDYKEAIKLDPDNKGAIHNLAAIKALQSTESERKEIVAYIRKEMEKEKKEYQDNVMKAKKYEERVDYYDSKFHEANKIIGKYLTCLQVLGASLYIGIWIFYNFSASDPKWYALLSSIGSATLVLSLLIWTIHIKIRDRDRLWALREDAYTKSILTRLVDSNFSYLSELEQGARKEMLIKYFEHHSQFSSTRLILGHEKGEAQANVVQNFGISPTPKSNSDE